MVGSTRFSVEFDIFWTQFVKLSLPALALDALGSGVARRCYEGQYVKGHFSGKGKMARNIDRCILYQKGCTSRTVNHGKPIQHSFQHTELKESIKPSEKSALLSLMRAPP